MKVSYKAINTVPLVVAWYDFAEQFRQNIINEYLHHRFLIPVM
jgi:hypothetical protein